MPSPMRARLTERQNQVYEFLRDFVRRRGKPPTIKEVGESLGIKSTNGVHKMLVVLEKKGYITRTPNEARGLQIVDDAGLVGEEPPGVLMLKLTEGAGHRQRKVTSDAIDFPLPRSAARWRSTPASCPTMPISSIASASRPATTA